MTKISEKGVMDFDCDAYLRRIGLDGAPIATESGLVSLQRAQALNIPFENFDIHLGRGISLAPDLMFEKLVNHRRGGYCFELNGLFGMALDAFGFERRPVLGRVHLRGEPTGRMHLFNLVRLNGRDWVADPGFGLKQAREPIPLELDRIEIQEGAKFRLVDGGAFGTMAQFFEEGVWRNWYSFDLEPVWPADVEMSNYYTSTSPESFFTQVRLAIQTVPSGRTTLMDFRLREQSNGETTETLLKPGRGYLYALETHFGIAINASYEALKPVGGERTLS